MVHDRGGRSLELSMRKLSFGVFLVALATLVLELMLTRVFDVILAPNISYFVVTAAVFAFGLAGIYATLRPIPAQGDISGRLCVCSAGFAAMTVLQIPIVNRLQLDYTTLGHHPLAVGGSFLVLYLTLLAPFFLGGYVLITVFTRYAARIQRLYFWDLTGAGVGSVLVIPFISAIGPGGLILCAAALALLAAALFSGSRIVALLSASVAVLIAVVPFVHAPQYIDFAQHMDKRGVKDDLAAGLGEVERWDPISKINVINKVWSPDKAEEWWQSGDHKDIQYDGGNQTSHFFPFDGNVTALRALLDHDLSHVKEHFWHVGVLASHFLKRDSGQSVLVIGSAGGQETTAALVYGATYIDAVELVPTVVDLASGPYSHYIGDLYRNPAVHIYAGEGRSFLRRARRSYDIIQIFSNATSSSIAQGTGALSPGYLQTAEAYEEYFSHLTPDGILHINQNAYPRMITTAALAWRRMGRTDFASHVAVFASPTAKTLPAMLIKMKPWTPGELASVSGFLARADLPLKQRMVLVEDPLSAPGRLLSADFYSGAFPAALAASLPVDFSPRTDDRPYFGFLRRHIRLLQADPIHYLDEGTAYSLNISMLHGVPMDLVHLFMTGAASLLFVFLFVYAPLRYSAVGQQSGATALPLMIYFSCLGAGFIIIELVCIQKFMYLIGSPLYTYSTVIFTLLLGAGIGSSASEWLGIGPTRWSALPFVAVVTLGVLLEVIYPGISRAALSLGTAGRVLVAGLLLFPIGFFLGMPFPLGVLAIANGPRGAVAWAWGMNGLFTVVGGLLSMLLSLRFGFNLTILFALALYVVAMLSFSHLRKLWFTGSSTGQREPMSQGVAAAAI
jgi:spermidine synthase